MPNYFIYGLHIHTEKPLRELIPHQKKENIDLTIHWSTQDVDPSANDWQAVKIPVSRQRKHIQLWKSSTTALIRFRYTPANLGPVECIINHNANQLWIYYSKLINEDDMSSFVLGTVLGCVLRHRQMLCLHASVVEINGKGIVLMGSKRAGKSTTAAALIKYANAHLVADDIAVINGVNRQLTVHAGYAGLRLSPAAINHLYGEESTNLPKVYADQAKHYVFLGEKNHPHFVPIKHIYVLDKDRDMFKNIIIQTLSEPASMMQLTANTYARYALFEKESIAQEFNLIAQLLKTTKVSSIKCPSDLNRLPQLCEAIQDYHDLG